MKGFINDIWWMLLLRGLALLLFGIAAVVWPGLTLVTLALYFAVLMLVSGIADMLVAIGAAAHRRSWFVTLMYPLGDGEIPRLQAKHVRIRA